jgi:hypothetical protein
MVAQAKSEKGKCRPKLRCYQQDKHLSYPTSSMMPKANTTYQIPKAKTKGKKN